MLVLGIVFHDGEERSILHSTLDLLARIEKETLQYAILSLVGVSLQIQPVQEKFLGSEENMQVIIEGLVTVMLSTSERVQTTAVELLGHLVQTSQMFVEVVLKSDLIDFLFECLKSNYLRVKLVALVTIDRIGDKQTNSFMTTYVEYGLKTQMHHTVMPLLSSPSAGVIEVCIASIMVLRLFWKRANASENRLHHLGESVIHVFSLIIDKISEIVFSSTRNENLGITKLLEAVLHTCVTIARQGYNRDAIESILEKVVRVVNGLGKSVDNSLV
jgi:uncharacterized membrane protein YhaH (DUF805 family)